MRPRTGPTQWWIQLAASRLPIAEAGGLLDWKSQSPKCLMEAGAVDAVDLALCRLQTRYLLLLAGRTRPYPCSGRVDVRGGISPAPQPRVGTVSEQVARVLRLVLVRARDSFGVELPIWFRLLRYCTRILFRTLDRASILDYQRDCQVTCDICGGKGGSGSTVCRRTADEVSSICCRSFKSFLPSTFCHDKMCKHSVPACVLAYHRSGAAASHCVSGCFSTLHCYLLQEARIVGLT